MFKILILILTCAKFSYAQRERPQYINNGTKLFCIPDPSDNSTCIYTDLNDPYELFRKLPDVGNPRAAAITKLKFYKCYIDNLQSQIVTLFPNIVEIQASGQYLTRLDRSDIGKSETLKNLNVSYNRIHRLSTDVISGLQNLESFDISHNILERIMPDAFKYNVNLKYLNMSHNQIVSLDRQLFDALRNVAIIKLNNNKITEITGDFEHFLAIFTELHLQNNFLLSIDSRLVKNPTYLDLSLNKLTELDLTGARTKELKVVGNQLKRLVIGHKLEKLDASENRFYSFKIEAGSNLNNLAYLNLSYIKYNFENEKLLIDFRKFEKLQVLDLSDNNLITFDITDIAYGVSRTLEVLNLQNAHVKKLINWDKIEKLLPRLRELNIYDNIFNCDELKQMIPELQQLNITLPGYESNDNDTFVSRSCSTIYDNKVFDAKKPGISIDHTVLIWCFIAFFMVGFFVTGLVFINRKLSVFEKLFDVIKVSPHKPRGSKLLDEEKANDTENSF
jgi:Leucine-rich repeat (LRR) protein